MMVSKRIDRVFDWAGVLAIVLTILATVSLAIQVVDLMRENDAEVTRLVKLEQFQQIDRRSMCLVTAPLFTSQDPQAVEAAKQAETIYKCKELKP